MSDDLSGSANPFRRRLRRRDVDLKTVVWHANEQGKDTGVGKTDFALNQDYLWIAFDFSVPLQWITAVEDLGPGFIISWENPIDGGTEASAFCVRTMFGYNRRKRDELVARVRSAVEVAAKRPRPASTAAAEVVPKCQVCNAPGPRVYDFEWLTNFLAIMIKKPDRRVLCHAHARWHLRRVSAWNLIMGNLGYGVFVSPVIGIRNVRQARQRGAVGAVESKLWIALVLWPYALLAWMVGWSIWYAITF